ncbi:MAG: dUTP diphosphatase, partial [Firmicutes bacterium]|nr:dUTP diphosphatase [Candidatus Colimorpha enterica]
DAKEQTIENGERVGRLMILPVICPEYKVVDELGETERGAGGFGSTGTK